MDYFSVCYNFTNDMHTITCVYSNIGRQITAKLFKAAILLADTTLLHFLFNFRGQSQVRELESEVPKIISCSE